MLLPIITTLFLLQWAIFLLFPGQAIPRFFTSERDTGPGQVLAHLTSRVLFNSRRTQENVPIFAYGYLSRVGGLSPTPQKEENESSAVLTFFIDGQVVDLEQSGTAFMVESEGALRIFFAPRAKRSFMQPDSFRSGEEVATYNLKRYVFFEPASGRLEDRSFASLVSRKPFTFRGVQVDLQRLWGTQLVIEAQGRGEETLPSPLPDYSAAIPYTGVLFIGGERTNYTPPPCCNGVCLSRDRQGVYSCSWLVARARRRCGDEHEPRETSTTACSRVRLRSLCYCTASRFFCAREKLGLRRKAVSNWAAASALRPRRI